MRKASDVNLGPPYMLSTCMHAYILTYTSKERGAVMVNILTLYQFDRS